jgi:hypothetical protein
VNHSFWLSRPSTQAHRRAYQLETRLAAIEVRFDHFAFDFGKVTLQKTKQTIVA